MSTKTAFKRVALVAAAALAIGGISAVSAQAAWTGITATSTATLASTTGVVGTPVTGTFTTATTVATTQATTDTLSITPVVTTVPNGSALTLAKVTVAQGALSTSATAVAPVLGVVVVTAGQTGAAVSSVNTYTFTPDVAGTYVLTVTPSGAGTNVGHTFTVVVAQNTTPLINGSSSNATASVVTGNYTAETFQAGTADKYYTITTSGVGSVNYPSAGTANGGHASTVTLGTSTVWSDGSGAIGTGTGFTGSETLPVSVYSAVAGTQVVTITGNVSAAITLTITWGAAPSFSAAYSTAINNNVADAGTNAATSDDTLSVAKTAIAGDIAVVIKNGSNTAYNGTTVSASVSGAGLVAFGANTSATTVGTAKVASVTLTGLNTTFIYLSGDGTAGTGTITISVTDGSTTTVLATKTVTFTGSVAGLKAQQNLFVLKAAAGNTYAGTTSINDATSTTVALKTPLTVFATDANGNKSNASANVKLVSSDSTVVTVGACTTATGTSAVIGEYNCSVNGTALAASGKTATVTAEASTDGGTTFTILATPVTFTIGGSIAAVSIATDVVTYVVGSPLKIVATAKDSAGNLAYDQDAALFTSSGLVASTVLGGAILPTNVATTVINGVHTYSGFYAPVTSGSGTLTITGTDSTTAANAVSATATLTDPSSDSSNAATDAANEATDAANAATDAANAAADSADAATQAAQDASDQAAAALAAVTALSQQVTGLTAKIAALASSLAKITATLAKVASKVKA